MNHIALDISISLDGYVAGPNRTAKDPLGVGGDRLHNWMSSDDGQALLARMVDGLGAVIAGRRTYDDSVPFWGPDGPSGPARRPTFVLTHTAPDTSPENGVYQFVTSGLGDALALASAAAGTKTACVMGGGKLARQVLAAGVVREISLHVVPVLLGGGVRLFDGVPNEACDLKLIEAIDTPTAVHTRYAVIGPASRESMGAQLIARGEGSRA